MTPAQKPTPSNIEQWAREAEDDLDARNAHRLRKAGGRIAQLEGDVNAERDRNARLQAAVDRYELQAHSIKVLRNSNSKVVEVTDGRAQGE